MKLVKEETTYKYDTRILLEAMIDLSESNINRFSGSPMGELNSIFSSITSYDTGRQTGKSTTLVNYLNDTSNKNIFIIARDQIHVKDLQYVAQSKIGLDNIMSVAPGPRGSNLSIFRGLGKFTLIFDECSTNEIRDFIERIEIPHYIKAVVKVGSH